MKKNVFFRALLESPNPSPPDPNSGNLVLVLVKIQDLKVIKQRFAKMWGGGGGIY